jgi:hypothetical protein
MNIKRTMQRSTAISTAVKTEELPPFGNYTAQITEAEITTPPPSSSSSSARDGHCLEMTWQITRGEYKNHLVRQSIPFQHSDTQVEEIGRRQLKDLCVACGITKSISGPDPLKSIPCRIKIGSVDGRNLVTSIWAVGSRPPREQARKQIPCPCCGQMTDAENLELARQDQSDPAEEPEQAFRRGYHHGVHIVVEALKGRIDLVLWQTLNAFANSVSNWRSAWSERRRRRPAPERAHSAPVPKSLLYGNSAAGADQLWSVLRYRGSPDSGEFNGGDFYGWHPLAEVAQAIHTDWCKRYPDWNVVLMVQNNARRSTKQAMAATETTTPGSAQLPPSPTSH